MKTSLLFAKTPDTEIALTAKMANRHGLISGATGTGKTVTLQVLAEQFSLLGVPVFLADVKGDLSGIAAPGSASDKFQKRLDTLHISDWKPSAFPVQFWDVLGESGHPLRATVSDMGPILLSRLLNLNDTQEGVLQVCFKVADDQGLLLLDLVDLRAMVQWVGENARELTTEYGNVSAASVGAIQRALLPLEQQGAEAFFGEPMLNIADLMQTDENGRGVINILSADKLMQAPRLYGASLLWLLSELFENLPEVGDPEKPKLVFFFDEAHLLFNDAPKALIEKIETVVRLIRSKGVGVYFVTQNPMDVPDTVLGQLGNRIQHALRAFTPRDQKAVRAAAETMPINPSLDIETEIIQLGLGEALITVLDGKGKPTATEKAFITPPASRMGPIDANDRQRVIQQSLVYGVYEKEINRESAFELLKERAEQKTEQLEQEKAAKEKAKEEARSYSSNSNRQSTTEAFFKSAARAVGSELGRKLIRGVLGSLLGGRR